MRLVAAMLAVWPLCTQAQEFTSAERARFLETARGRYYNLTGLGLKSFTCQVNFDLGALSKGLLPENDPADRALPCSRRDSP